MMETSRLLRKYFERRRKTPGFSMRSVARRVGISPSFLSRVLSGKKPVPFPLLLRLKTALDIEPEVFAGLKEAHSLSSEILIPKRGKAQVQTSLQDWDLAGEPTCSILRHWYYLPILEFTTVQAYDGTSESIAQALGLTVGVVELAMRELKFQGLLVVEKGGRRVKSTHRLRWTTAKSRNEVREFHRQMMTRAQQELVAATSSDDFERRLITGITFTTSPEKIASAKRKLAECIHEIVNDLLTSQGSEVYHLATQLIHLTRK